MLQKYKMILIKIPDIDAVLVPGIKNVILSLGRNNIFC